MATVAPSTDAAAPAGWKPQYATAIRDPKWDLAFAGILAYVVIEYTRLPAMFPVLIPFQVGKIAVLMATVGMLFGARFRKKASPVVSAIDLLLAVFVVGIIMSAIRAESLADAVDAVIMMVQWGVIYFLVSRVTATSWRLRIFLFLYLLLNFKIAQFGIRGYFLGVQAYGAEAMAKFGSGAGSTGFFSNAGDFGVAMATVWPIGTALLFARLKAHWRFLLLVNTLVTFGAIIFCQSRGALVAAAVVSLVAWIRNPKRILGPLLILVFALGTYFVLPQANKDRLFRATTPEQDETANLRLALWRSGIRMFKDNPVIGVGIGNFPVVYERYYADRSIRLAEWSPHSVYIQALSELGALGTAPVVGLWVLFFVLNAKTRRHLNTAGKAVQQSLEYCLSLGLDLGMVGFLASGAFLTVLYYPHIWLLLGLSVALNFAVMAKPAVEFVPTQPVVRKKFSPGVA